MRNWDGSAEAEAFLGVPFARPPVGELRFASPVDWDAPYAGGALNSTATGPSCPQPDWSQQNGTAYRGSEDCLVLNIWRPAGVGAGAKLPVLFYIHGGAFVSGDAANPQYDGANLATANGAVVVSTQYRLGALGWAKLKDGDANCGLWDQIRALQWVRIQVFQRNSTLPNLSNHILHGQVKFTLRAPPPPLAPGL